MRRWLLLVAAPLTIAASIAVAVLLPQRHCGLPSYCHRGVPCDVFTNCPDYLLPLRIGLIVLAIVVAFWLVAWARWFGHQERHRKDFGARAV